MSNYWRPSGPFPDYTFRTALSPALFLPALILIASLSPFQARAETPDLPGGDGNPTGPRVTHTSIDLTLEPERGLLREVVEIRVEGQGQRRLIFRIGSNLTVERSSASSGLVEHRKAGGRLELRVDPPLESERTFTFLVTGRPRRGRLDLVGPQWAILGGSDDWYPRLDGTWSGARVKITVPDGWTAVGPGDLRDGDDGNVWDWRTDMPVRSIAVAAAPGLKITEDVVVQQTFRLAAPANAPTARDLAPRFTDAMAWHSGALVPYPFSSYNLALIPALPVSARGSGVLAVPDDIPMESRGDAGVLLSGQWFGERLSGDGAWMEAFAAWQAVAYARDRALPVPEAIEGWRRDYRNLASAADVALSRASADSPPAVLVGKGSAAPDMVRLVVGNRKFFRAVGDLFREPPEQVLTLDRVRAVLEKRAGQRLHRVFRDWFDRTGIPRLDVTVRTFPSATGGFRTDLTFQQVGSAYSHPVDVVLFGPGRKHRETVEIDEETTTVMYILPFKPVRIEIDPLGKLFQRPPTVTVQ